MRKCANTYSGRTTVMSTSHKSINAYAECGQTCDTLKIDTFSGVIEALNKKVETYLMEINLQKEALKKEDPSYGLLTLL